MKLHKKKDDIWNEEKDRRGLYIAFIIAFAVMVIIFFILAKSYG